jgi:alpha-1,2-mannosyltransferase
MFGACLGLLKLLVLAPYFFVKIRYINQVPEVSEIKNVGLFHVPAHANGGGEKVLWAIVNKLIEEKKYNIYIYSDKIADKAEMIGKVNRFFGYSIKPTDFNLVELDSGYLTYSEHWKFFSRYLEAASHALVAFEALDRFMPDIFIETFTAHFSPITAKLLNPKLKVITYVHYPFTSPTVIKEYFETMLQPGVSLKTRLFAAVKLVYHYGLYLAYKVMGLFSDQCYTNSSWTQRHMEGNWGEGACQVLYPPCNVDEFWSEDYSGKQPLVVSLGQYRSEKRHDVQLDMMKHHLQKNPASPVKFKIMGSGKFEESERIYRHLLQRIQDEGIRNVEVLKDLRFDDLMNTIKSATFGVHTMIDEHFGISVVEMLAGGLVVLAHDSAGPKDDILGNHTHALYGLLAKNDADFNETFHRMIEDHADPAKRTEMLAKVKAGQQFARENLSNEAFALKFVNKIGEFDQLVQADAARREQIEAEERKRRKSEEKKGEQDI